MNKEFFKFMKEHKKEGFRKEMLDTKFILEELSKEINHMIEIVEKEEKGESPSKQVASLLGKIGNLLTTKASNLTILAAEIEAYMMAEQEITNTKKEE